MIFPKENRYSHMCRLSRSSLEFTALFLWGNRTIFYIINRTIHGCLEKSNYFECTFEIHFIYFRLSMYVMYYFKTLSLTLGVMHVPIGTQFLFLSPVIIGFGCTCICCRSYKFKDPSLEFFDRYMHKRIVFTVITCKRIVTN